MNKVAVITGTSSGVGLELAVMLAKEGYTTIATMRNLSKQATLLSKAESEKVSITVLPLDVQSAESVDACFKHVLAEYGRIDILVNNAGAGYVRTTEQATDEDVHTIMYINFNGVVRCTRAVLPVMRQQSSGRIINVSSVGGLVGQPFNEIYCAAKFAVEGYTESLATYVQPAFGIKFSLVEPGGISTEFVNNVMSRIMQTGGFIEDEYSPILAKYVGGRERRVERGEVDSFQTPTDVANVILGVISQDEPPLRIRTSSWAEDLCRFKTQADPTGKQQTDMVIKKFLE